MLGILLLSVTLSFVVGGANAQTTNENWGYTLNGMEWVGLCKTGLRQSPIDIDDSDTYEVRDQTINLSLNRFTGTTYKESWENQRYTVSRNDWLSIGEFTAVPAGSLSASTYYCYNYQFHSPSEHTIDGDRFDLEM
jgi:carbonic anhydrase